MQTRTFLQPGAGEDNPFNPPRGRNLASPFAHITLILAFATAVWLIVAGSPL